MDEGWPMALGPWRGFTVKQASEPSVGSTGKQEKTGNTSFPDRLVGFGGVLFLSCVLSLRQGLAI